MPSPDLNHAITHTTLSRLQSLVRRLCDASPTARALVEQELLASSSATNVIDLTSEEPQQTIQQIVSTDSAKRQRYAMCEHCKEEFDVTDNAEDSWSLEIDWDGDFWADHDEDCHGTIDLDLADESPEGFEWTCCKGDGDAEGCTTGPHKVDERYKPEEVKRRRV
ncbi:unnamed protein product, partial [Aureobasidium uvarum]